MTDIAVVGSINLDISVGVRSLPHPGETVLGSDAVWSGGGKGANQAVALSRLGRVVSMVGCVGDDSAGRDMVARLVADRVEVGDVAVVPGVATGLALIAVDSATGENSIVVSPGANSMLTSTMVAQSSALGQAAVVLFQLEVPIEAVVAASLGAKGLVVLNPAPASVDALALLELVDLVVPNQHELATLAGVPPMGHHQQLLEAAWGLGGDADVVVTLGSEGALVVPRRSGGTELLVPAAEGLAVDTTGAGDAFCAGLADTLAGGEGLVDAARWATKVAALTVQKRGAQDSFPFRKDVV